MGPPEAVPIRDAATVILVRDPASAPRILMGQRGTSAVFMPKKFVFPGGAVDATDAPAANLSAICAARLTAEGGTSAPGTYAAAAMRELLEETGQRLTDATALRFFFRALTPPGRPRRFDARFFLADAAALASDPDDFSEAEAELSHIQWVSITRARELDLPFITRLVLAELEKHLPRTDAPDRVPFVRNDDMESQVVWL